MQIKSIQNFNNKFGSRKVFPVKVRKKNERNEYDFVNAKFTSLSPQSKRDRDAMDEILHSWYAPKCEDNYISNIVSSFKTNKYSKSYAIELEDVNTKKLAPRILSLIQITDPNISNKECMEVFYLQASPVILWSEDTPIVRGSGEMAMYGAVKLAQKNQFDRLEVFSTNDGFYDKIGLPLTCTSSVNLYGNAGSFYELQRNDYARFLNNIDRKYSLKPDKTK